MMDVEQVARLHAALLSGQSWDALFPELRVTRAQWIAAEKACLAALTSELNSGESHVTRRYLRAFYGEPASRDASTDTSAISTVLPTSTGKPMDSSPAASGLPAFLPKGMAAFASVDGTQLAPSGAGLTPSLPFAPSNAPQGIDTVPQSVHTTADASAANASAREGAGWMPRGMSQMTDLEGTQLASPSSALPSTALPFGQKESPKEVAVAPSPEASPPPDLPAWMPKGMAKFMDVDGTQLAPSGGALGKALPFETNPASQVPPVSERSTQLTIQQYASFRVELELLPAQRREVLQRYHLDEAQTASLDAYWGARIAAEPEIKLAWSSAYTAYRAWLSTTLVRG